MPSTQNKAICYGTTNKNGTVFGQPRFYLPWFAGVVSVTFFSGPGNLWYDRYSTGEEDYCEYAADGDAGRRGLCHFCRTGIHGRDTLMYT